MAVLKKISLVDQIYDQIRTNIINLTYPLGSKINVNELQEVFEVSSTPLREAITRLQVEGLVTYESNVGARVISLTPKDIQDIQDLALTLHSAAIRFAMERGDYKKMADEIERYVKNYKNAKSTDVMIKNVFDLIGTFYRYCGNDRLDANMKVIQGQQLILRHLYFSYMGMSKRNTADYESIAEAVLQGDGGRVIEILTNIYNLATPVLIEALAHQEQSAHKK